jgi:gas vesicle protein
MGILLGVRRSGNVETGDRRVRRELADDIHVDRVVFHTLPAYHENAVESRSKNAYTWDVIRHISLILTPFMVKKFAKAAGAAAIVTMLLSGPVLAQDTATNTSTSSGTSTLDQLKEQRKDLQEKIKEERERLKEEREHKKEEEKAAREAKAQAMRACIATAVSKREAAIGSGWSTYSASTTAALAARKTALEAAWAKTDRTERKAAVAAAWKSWRETHRKLLADWRKAKKSAWETFSKDRRACGNGAASEAPENSSVDAQL